MSWLTLEDSKNTGEAPLKTIWIESPPDPYAIQREAAIKLLGPRWVCDKSRYVQRGQYEQRESHGADVAATFARVAGPAWATPGNRMVPEPQIILEAK